MMMVPGFFHTRSIKCINPKHMRQSDADTGRGQKWTMSISAQRARVISVAQTRAATRLLDILVDLLSFNASTHTHQIPITQIEFFTTSDVASPDLALQGRAHARPAASNSKKPRASRHRAVAVHPAAHEFEPALGPAIVTPVTAPRSQLQGADQHWPPWERLFHESGLKRPARARVVHEGVLYGATQRTRPGKPGCDCHARPPLAGRRVRRWHKAAADPARRPSCSCPE